MPTPSKAKAGRKAVVSIGGITGAAGGTFLPIEELMQSNFSGASWGTTEVTNFDSNADEEFITTTRNNGTVSLKGNLIDLAPGQAALEAAYQDGIRRDFKVQMPPGPGDTTGVIYAFSALVESFLDINVEVKSAVQFTSSLKISGAVTKTPAVPAS